MSLLPQGSAITVASLQATSHLIQQALAMASAQMATGQLLHVRLDLYYLRVYITHFWRALGFVIAWFYWNWHHPHTFLVLFNCTSMHPLCMRMLLLSTIQQGLAIPPQLAPPTGATLPILLPKPPQLLTTPDRTLPPTPLQDTKTELKKPPDN